VSATSWAGPLQLSRALTPEAGGSWPLSQGRSLGWVQAALGSKRIFRLWQLVLGGDRSAAEACSPSVTWKRAVTEALGVVGVFCLFFGDTVV
jgi:hypothetical protein